MRNLFLRFCRWALPLLGVSGAVSCDNVIGSRAEYGVPTMEYRVRGKVLSSESDEPVKGIAVTGMTEDGYERIDTVWTTENGEFLYDGYDFPSDHITLRFTDVDGFDNLGEFQKKEVQVVLTREEGSQSGWFSGVYVSDDLLVRLDPLPEVEYGVPYSEYSSKEHAD